MEKMIDVKYELFDAFVEEDWFYDIRIIKTLFDDVYEVELIVNENANIHNLNDVRDEIIFHDLKIYDDNYFITKRNVKNTYSVKFFVKGWVDLSKDWTGNKNSIFKMLGSSNHTERERHT